MMLRLRLQLLCLACRVLLPKNVWVGKHFGAYTRKYDVVFGRLDSRGVLQGIEPKDINDNQ